MPDYTVGRFRCLKARPGWPPQTPPAVIPSGSELTSPPGRAFIKCLCSSWCQLCGVGVNYEFQLLLITTERVFGNKLASLYLSVCFLPCGAWVFQFRGALETGKRKKGRTAACENLVSSCALSSQVKGQCYGLGEMLSKWKHLHVPTLTIWRCQPLGTEVPVLSSSMAWWSSAELGHVRQTWFASCLFTLPAVKPLAI